MTTATMRAIHQPVGPKPSCSPRFLKAGASTSEMTDMSLMRMLSAGPEVSLNGSPTVSPTTVASKCSFSVLLRPSCLAYFLALSHAPPALDMATASMKPLASEPIKQLGLNKTEKDHFDATVVGDT